MALESILYKIRQDRFRLDRFGDSIVRLDAIPTGVKVSTHGFLASVVFDA